MQDKVHRLKKEPYEDDRLEIERLRSILGAKVENLHDLQRRAVLDFQRIEPYSIVDADIFDYSDEEDTVTEEVPLPADSLPAESFGTVPIELCPLSIPSTALSVDHPLRSIELGLRILQAKRCLHALREAIADKSFQYLHVIRKASRQAMRLRSRKTIIKLNNQLTYYSRIYYRCRAALLRLGADEQTMQVFQVLKKEDLKASTALINPNTPGSTKVRVSWLWESAGDAVGTAKTKECESFVTCHLFL